METALYVCSLCGAPVEISRHDAELLPTWEARLGQPLVIHCLGCAELLLEEA